MKLIDVEFDEYARKTIPSEILKSPEAMDLLRRTFWAGGLSLMALFSVAAESNDVEAMAKQLADDAAGFITGIGAQRHGADFCGFEREDKGLTKH